MAKTAEQVKELIDALREAGFEPESYSGRGMYGRYCVSVEDCSAWECAQALSHLDVPEPKEDAMGKGNVLYWPSYEWPKDEVTA